MRNETRQEIPFFAEHRPMMLLHLVLKTDFLFDIGLKMLLNLPAHASLLHQLLNIREQAQRFA